MSTPNTAPFPILTVSQLRFTYRGAGQPALDDVSFIQNRNEFIAIMGQSGAGKSTLCRRLNGLIPVFVKGELTGELSIDGRLVEHSQVYATAREVGLVFQDFEAQLFSTNVELEVAFALENFAISRNEMVVRVREALARVGLAGFETRDPSTLSGGEKQRLAIASVLAGRPRIVVMDEPTTDLDPIGKREVFELAQVLRNELEGIILVEHETEHVLLADRLVFMKDGRIVRDGTPGDLLADPDAVEALGIRPLQTTVLLKRLGLPTDALTIADAAIVIKQAGWRVKDTTGIGAAPSRPVDTPALEPVIEVKQLTYRYETGKVAVDAVSLTIQRGEFVAIVGQNGCGKTTLVKQFNGLSLPTTGTVTVLGKDTRSWRLSDLGRKVGYVFQNPDHQIFANTIWEEVAFGPKNYGYSEEEIRLQVANALLVVGLGGRETHDPFGLTKGERQQLAVASVLATAPEILILDEPTTGLDYTGQRAILDLVRRLNAAGTTVVMITHSMWVVAEYASRCVLMNKGQVVMDTDIPDCFADLDLLESLSLEAPEAVRLGKELNIAARHVDGIVACLEKPISAL